MRRFPAFSMIVALWLSADFGQSQVSKEPASKPDSLEELQAEALKNNPDIKVALAQVRLAEAKLDQVRAKLRSELPLTCAELEAARAGFAEASERYQRTQKMQERCGGYKEELAGAKLTIDRLQHELVVRESQLQFLLGRPSVQKRAPVKSRDK